MDAYLDNGDPRASSHGTGKVVGGIPKDSIPSFINFGCSDEGHVAFNRLFHYVRSTIESPRLSRLWVCDWLYRIWMLVNEAGA